MSLLNIEDRVASMELGGQGFVGESQLMEEEDGQQRKTAVLKHF